MGYETSLQLFIDGVWKSGEGRDSHPVVNPVNASPIAEVPYATKADLDEALAASERAWPEWRSTDVEKRGAILLGAHLGSFEAMRAQSGDEDLPINIVSEEWYSPELQVLVLTKQNDPRTGETMDIAATIVPRFTAGSNLKQSVRK